MTTEYQVRKLSEVIRYFAKDFAEMDGSRIYRVEHWVDIVKDEVVFRVYIEDKIKP